MGLRPTFYDLELNDGTMVQVTRNYAGLYMLKMEMPEAYRRVQELNRDSAQDDIKLAETLYYAYVTATLVNNNTRRERGEEPEEIIKLEDFLALIPTDQYVIANIFEKLYGKEKKELSSPKHFGKKQKK